MQIQKGVAQMSHALNAAVEELREQLAASIESLKEDPKMAEVLKLHAALNTMEELIGAPPTSLSAAFALEPSMTVPPGEFYGMNALKAAKRFLKMRGRPGASLNEIVAAVRAGGAKIDSVDKLRVSLGRSTTDVAIVGTGHYALLEFYPHVQRGKKGKTTEGETTDNEGLLSPNEEDDLPALSLDENDIEDLIEEADKHKASGAE
jgi:hypothetical protein